MTDTDITTAVSSFLAVPDVLGEGEGRELLTQFEDLAANHIRRSADELTIGIIYLNAIREHDLFTYGGYEEWGPYLDDFKAQRGFSRSLIYENLKVARLAMGGMALNEDEVLMLGIPRLKPVTRLVKVYNRETGEITQLASGVADKLAEFPGETDGQRLGEWVRENLNPEEDTVATVHSLLDKELPYKVKHQFFPVRNFEGALTDVAWEAVYPDGTDEAGHSMEEMPQHVQGEFFSRLRIREG